MQSFVESEMSPLCRLAIVIPAYQEHLLMDTLSSIENGVLMDKDAFEIIVILNTVKGELDQTFRENIETISLWKKTSDLNVSFVQLVFCNKKMAGVGRARKIGMDLALYRFRVINRLDGLIVNLDADCLVSNNYVNGLIRIQKDLGVDAGSIHFEHPLIGDNSGAIYEYELHLRYYIQAQRWLGLKYAYQTIGSAMFVRANMYAKVGGMNNRKAGEDFYFIHKLTMFNYVDVNDICVYPSSRISDRVPFGTGRAMMEYEGKLGTYSFDTFKLLRHWLSDFLEIDHMNDIPNYPYSTENNPEPIIRYFSHDKRKTAYQQVISNVSSLGAFKNRFLHWFNAFELMKFVHFARDHIFPNQPVRLESRRLLSELSSPDMAADNVGDLLENYRKLHISNQWSAGANGKA